MMRISADLALSARKPGVFQWARRRPKLSYIYNKRMRKLVQKTQQRSKIIRTQQNSPQYSNCWTTVWPFTSGKPAMKAGVTVAQFTVASIWPLPD